MDQTVPVTGNDPAVRDHLDLQDRQTRRKMEIETLIIRLQYNLKAIETIDARLLNILHVAKGVQQEIHSIATDLNRNCTELQQTLVDGTLGLDNCEVDNMILKFLNDQCLL